MTLPATGELPNYPWPVNARTFDAEFLRMMQQCMAHGEGIAPFDQSKDATITGMGNNVAGDLLCTTAGSGLGVSVAAGNAWVKGDSRSTQGLYFCYVDVAKTVTLAANSSGNPRIDAIILQVEDSDVSGANNRWQVTSQQGAATVGATLTNLTGAPGQSGGPALQSSALVLAYVLVPNGFAGPFVNATHILDRRHFAYRPGRVLGYKEITADTSGAGDKITVDVVGDNTHRVRVEAWATGMTNGSTILTAMRLLKDTGQIVEAGATCTAGEQIFVAPERSAPAFQGKSTFAVNVPAYGGTPVIKASASNPAFLVVRYV